MYRTIPTKKSDMKLQTALLIMFKGHSHHFFFFPPFSRNLLFDNDYRRLRFRRLHGSRDPRELLRETRAALGQMVIPQSTPAMCVHVIK